VAFATRFDGADLRGTCCARDVMQSRLHQCRDYGADFSDGCWISPAASLCARAAGSECDNRRRHGLNKAWVADRFLPWFRWGSATGFFVSLNPGAGPTQSVTLLFGPFATPAGINTPAE